MRKYAWTLKKNSTTKKSISLAGMARLLFYFITKTTHFVICDDSKNIELVFAIFNKI